MPNTIIVTREGAIAIVQLNRPAVLNALNAEVLTELGDAMRELDDDATCRCIVLTGNEKAFAAGADIKEAFVGVTPISMLQQDLTAKWEVIRRVKTPIIAAVSGFALGGGCELAMSCHVRIAADVAKFGQPEVKLGIIPGYGGTQRLPRLVGRGRALQLILTGETIDAQEALRIGLVNAVVPLPELMAAARRMMAQMLANGPIALALAIDTVDRGLDTKLDDAIELEAENFARCARTEDMREGARAFLEKRPAAFTGK